MGDTINGYHVGVGDKRSVSGKCPLPDGYSGTSTLDELSTDTTCRYGDTATDDKAACYANGQYAGDIYDCIPKTTDKATPVEGLCCPSRGTDLKNPSRKSPVLEGPFSTDLHPTKGSSPGRHRDPVLVQ